MNTTPENLINQFTDNEEIKSIRSKITYWQAMREDAQQMITSLLKEERDLQYRKQ